LLVGFKFEVGLSPENLVNLAHLSIKNNKCDLVVVNDKKTIKQSNQHVAQFVFSDEMKNSLIQDNTIFGKDEIADAIITFLLSKVFQ
jgi:phosphopantothenoylcysteine synthetase/decarboxylase